MKVALVVTWSGVVPGREKAALDYGAAVQEHWGRLAAEGRCSSPQMFFGERGSGMWIVSADHDTMHVLAESDTSRDLLTRGSFLLGDFGYEFFDTGDGADAFMQRYATVGASLGYI